MMTTHVPALKLSKLLVGFYVLWGSVCYFVTLRVLQLESLGSYASHMWVYTCEFVCVCAHTQIYMMCAYIHHTYIFLVFILLIRPHELALKHH